MPPTPSPGLDDLVVAQPGLVEVDGRTDPGEPGSDDQRFVVGLHRGPSLRLSAAGPLSQRRLRRHRMARGSGYYPSCNAARRASRPRSVASVAAGTHPRSPDSRAPASRHCAVRPAHRRRTAVRRSGRRRRATGRGPRRRWPAAARTGRWRGRGQPRRGSVRSTSPAYQRVKALIAALSRTGASAFSAKDGSEVSHIVDGYQSSWNATAGRRCRARVGRPRPTACRPRSHRRLRAGIRRRRTARRCRPPTGSPPRRRRRRPDRVLRGEPVIDRHHHGAGFNRVLAGGAVVGVEVADREAAAVEIHGDRRAGAKRPGIRLRRRRPGTSSGQYTRIGIAPRGPSISWFSTRRSGCTGRRGGHAAGGGPPRFRRPPSTGRAPLPVPSAGWRRSRVCRPNRA